MFFIESSMNLLADILGRYPDRKISLEVLSRFSIFKKASLHKISHKIRLIEQENNLRYLKELSIRTVVGSVLWGERRTVWVCKSKKSVRYTEISSHSLAGTNWSTWNYFTCRWYGGKTKIRCIWRSLVSNNRKRKTITFRVASRWGFINYQGRTFDKICVWMMLWKLM